MITEFKPGGYRYIPGVFQYSAGVEALPQFEVERVQFARPIPLHQGFELIERHIRAAGRPSTAFCACELRSPAPFSEVGFSEFNALYVEGLRRMGFKEGEQNPVARSNVCPAIAPPTEPSFHAFCFTRESEVRNTSFVIAGSAEAPEGKENYLEHAICRGDLSETGLRQKVVWVLSEMERRMGMFNATWKDTTAAQIYTVHDVHPHLASEIVPRVGSRHGLTVHFNRPPVQELEFEMDCRRVVRERVLDL